MPVASNRSARGAVRGAWAGASVMDGHAKSEAGSPYEEQKDGPRASRPAAPNVYGSYSKLTNSS
jgi:hypothetical protein